MRLSGVHPDLTGVSVVPAAAGTPKSAVYVTEGSDALLAFPILDGRGRIAAVLRLRFTLDERARRWPRAAARCCWAAWAPGCCW